MKTKTLKKGSISPGRERGSQRLPAKMELLAPAGTLEAFEAAVDNGADAVYIGAPHFNAREPARHFSPSEIAAMIDFAHGSGVKLYLAMNSLVKEGEIDDVVKQLVLLETLHPDALIIQDLGLAYILRKHFPTLRIHASTLTAAHNTMVVQQLAELGFSRVVLPRELTLDEIKAIARETSVELEVFGHGAMCFSYSGLCQFSSFQGGRSGLRGRCVQPCRRRYTWQGRGKGSGAGYLFSMNDLQSIDLIDQLRLAGIVSLKIEGRMRSAHYVGAVVKAYRLMLDNERNDPAILAEARGLLDDAMGRKPTRGFFPGRAPVDLITSHHSGNIGIFLGKVQAVRAGWATITLKGTINEGDRVRLHQEKSGERQGFALKAIRLGRQGVLRAESGKTVSIELPGLADPGDSIYKVDLSTRRGRDSVSKIRPEKFAARVKKISLTARAGKILSLLPAKGGASRGGPVSPGVRSGRQGKSLFPLEWWVKSDDHRILLQHFPALPAKVVVILSEESWRGFARMKKNGPLFDRVVWALPPLINGEKIDFYRRTITELINKGYREWQIGHSGQFGFFTGKKVRLFSDYQLNILNRCGLQGLNELGIELAVLSIETDRENIASLSGTCPSVRKGLVVYGFPPLFTARYTGAPLQFDRAFQSPKGESFVLKQRWDYTLAMPSRPFSLLSSAAELPSLGISVMIIDFSYIRLSSRFIDDFFHKVKIGRSGDGGGTFNYLHGLQ
ncbi:MAG: U32 family peptidase [Proteobacteria bacterium]|nr:U32 family peptidase [Pseudomonadota bacterium]MBU1686710.1 U32 family peptidase [Pseudomonadota bacterium]